MGEEFNDLQDSRLIGLLFQVEARYDYFHKKDRSTVIDAQLEIIKDEFSKSNLDSVKKFNERDIVTQDIILSCIAESLVETSELLGLQTAPDFRLYEDSNSKVIAGIRDDTDEGQIFFNAHNLNAIANYFEIKGVETEGYAMLEGALSHEMVHIYLSRYMKDVHKKTVEASRRYREGSVEEYNNDPAEKVANKFAERYKIYRKNQRRSKLPPLDR